MLLDLIEIAVFEGLTIVWLFDGGKKCNMCFTCSSLKGNCSYSGILDKRQ